MSCGWCKKKPECDNWCWWCKQCTEACNCKLKWSRETSVWMEDSQTRVVDSPYNPHVVSTDNSVNITETQESFEDDVRTVYDLSVECCDSKVAVCAWDTNPWALVDKLDILSPLTIDVECWDKITIWLDQDLIDFPEDIDEKVAWESWCEWKYLDELIWLQDQFQWYDWPDPLTAWAVTNDCDKRYLGQKCATWSDLCKPRVKQAWKLRLEQNVVEKQIAWPQWIWQERFYIFLNWTTSTSNLSWVTAEFLNVNYSEELTMWWITYVDWWIKICRDGYYRIWYTWSQEHSRWCNWIRALVFAAEAPWQPLIPLLESRLSPISDPWVPVAWTWPPVNYWTTAWGSTGLNAWFSFLERSPFSWTDIYKLRKDTVIFFWMKVSSVIDDPNYNTANLAERAVLWKNAIGSWPSWDIGMQFHVESIDDICHATAFKNCWTC